MAVVAGIFSEIARIGMAGGAACTVVKVEPEIAVVIEGSRFPALRAVTIRTVR
jgi:hypothetical protein